MPFSRADTPLVAPPSITERVLQGLSTYLDRDKKVDVVTFFEDKQYLGQRLYPRQRLILKVTHRLPLEKAPCYLCETEPAPDRDCRWCHGTGWYDEFEDAKELLACRSIYARMYVPGLCEHHITGSCDKEICHSRARRDDYRLLDDDEIRERLLAQEAYINVIVAGRRGSKSFLMSGEMCFAAFGLLSDPNPQRTYGLSEAASTISIGNAANEEKQAKVVFEGAKGLIENSPWFQKLRPDSKDIEVVFPGRKILLRCYHANAKSVRGGTNKEVYLDEYFVMSAKDQLEIWKALAYSTATFARRRKRRIVICSTPDVREGSGYDFFDGAARHVLDDVVAFQLASWEMNPTVTRETFAADFANDPLGAEIELAAQFADSVRNYIPPGAVDACVPLDAAGRPTLRNQAPSAPHLRYSLHFDNSIKTDPAGLVITHWDEPSHSVVTDWIEEFDPKAGDPRIVTHGEIDQEKVLEHILELRDKYGFRFVSLTFDQFNSAYLAQRLRREFSDPDGNIVRIIPATDKSNREAFSTLRDLIVQQALSYPRYPRLIEQLKALVLIKKEGSDAWKVSAPGRQHDDLADALAVSSKCSLDYAIVNGSGLHVVELYKKTNGHILPAEEPPNHAIDGEPPHHPDCTSRYCDYRCEWQRARRDGLIRR